MRFDSAAGVEEQHRKAFAFGVEIGVARDVQTPVVGGFLRGVAKLQAFRGGAFPERDNLVLVGLRVEFEGLNKLVQTGQDWLSVRGGNLRIHIFEKLGRLEYRPGGG
jgi:hypothetical protein